MKNTTVISYLEKEQLATVSGGFAPIEEGSDLSSQDQQTTRFFEQPRYY